MHEKPIRWMIALLVAAYPALAQAAAPKPKVSPAVQRRCEAEARRAYKLRTTEVEMALIAGSLDELEVSRAREGLSRRLRMDEEECNRDVFIRSQRPRLARTSRSENRSY
jgi:hypothetical protein